MMAQKKVLGIRTSRKNIKVNNADKNRTDF